MPVRADRSRSAAMTGAILTKFGRVPTTWTIRIGRCRGATVQRASERVDPAGELEIGRGEAARGVVGDRHLDLAPRDRRGPGGGPSPPPARRSASTNSTEPTKSPRSNDLVIASPSRLPAVEVLEPLGDLVVVRAGPSCGNLYPRSMRIASLVPSATEVLFALGLGDEVVAVTHECDHPPAARGLPRLTASVIPERPRRRRDRRRGPRADRARRGALRARRGAARRARAGPDRHPGAVRGLRRLLRRRRARSPSACPTHAARCSRSTPRRSSEVLDDPVRLGDAGGEPERGRSAAGRARARGSRPSRDAVAGRAAPAGRRARVARPALRRRPLGAGDDRRRRRRRRARRARRALARGRRGRRSRAARARGRRA